MGKRSATSYCSKRPTDIEAEPDDILTFTPELKVTDNQYYTAKGYYLVSDDYDPVIEVETARSILSIIMRYSCGD